MAEDRGKLSEEQKTKIVSWLNQKVKNHNCPACGTNSWAIGDHLLSNNPFMGGMLVVGGATYPTAFLVCNNCAYIRQFMAVPMGLLPESGNLEENQEAQDG